jgi:hypothetical protein
MEQADASAPEYRRPSTTFTISVTAIIQYIDTTILLLALVLTSPSCPGHDLVLAQPGCVRLPWHRLILLARLGSIRRSASIHPVDLPHT